MKVRALNFLVTRWRSVLLFLVPVILSIANIPHRGVSEGGQGDIPKLSEKLDFWGSVLPIITRDNSLSVSFMLSLLSLSVYWLGFIMLITSYLLSHKEFWGILFLGSIGAVFVQQNLRDAFLLSFSMLSLGLVEKYSDSRKVVRKYMFLVPIVFAVSFKYPSAVAIALLVIGHFCIKKSRLNLRNSIVITLVGGLVVLSGIVVDKSLANFFSLKQGFPEQSVMYYDLASFFCWSEDSNTRNSAFAALAPSLVNKSASSICLSHRPNAWIYLVRGGNFRDEGIGAPLVRLSGKKDIENFEHLRYGWLQTIIDDPIDYIQFKLIAATQILTVGNPFLFATQESVDFHSADSISDYLWIPISLATAFIGKLYLFSEIAIFFLLLLLVKGARIRPKIRELIIYLSLVHSVNLFVLSVSFVSDEARYVFPLLLLSYLLVFINLTSLERGGKSQ